MITGMFSDQETVNQALSALSHIGVEHDQVSVVLSQSIHGRHIGLIEETKGAEGTVVGATLGGAAGAIAAGILAIGTIIVFPFGIVAAGPIVAAMAGAGAGGLTGGLIGALAGGGIPKQQAVLLEDGVSQGKILIAVDVDGGKEALVREVLRSAGAETPLAA